MMGKKKKAKMGRPPKPLDEKQGVKVTVYMTEDERKQLEALADKEGISLSSLLMKPWRKEQ
jgi:hypothetical protein